MIFSAGTLVNILLAFIFGALGGAIAEHFLAQKRDKRREKFDSVQESRRRRYDELFITRDDASKRLKSLEQEYRNSYKGYQEYNNGGGRVRYDRTLNDGSKQTIDIDQAKKLENEIEVVRNELLDAKKAMQDFNNHTE